MKNKIIITLIILLIIAGAYIGYQEFQDYRVEVLQQGFEIGQQNIIYQINQKGEVPVLTLLENNQSQLNWRTIEQICNRK